MKVAELRSILESALENLEEFEDNQEVHMVSNTYFLGGCHVFLGVSGYSGGYVNLDMPVREEED